MFGMRNVYTTVTLKNLLEARNHTDHLKSLYLSLDGNTNAISVRREHNSRGWERTFLMKMKKRRRKKTL